MPRRSHHDLGVCTARAGAPLPAWRPAPDPPVPARARAGARRQAGCRAAGAAAVDPRPAESHGAHPVAPTLPPPARTHTHTHILPACMRNQTDQCLCTTPTEESTGLVLCPACSRLSRLLRAPAPPHWQAAPLLTPLLELTARPRAQPTQPDAAAAPQLVRPGAHTRQRGVVKPLKAAPCLYKSSAAGLHRCSSRAGVEVLCTTGHLNTTRGERAVGATQGGRGAGNVGMGWLIGWPGSVQPAGQLTGRGGCHAAALRRCGAAALRRRRAPRQVASAAMWRASHARTKEEGAGALKGGAGQARRGRRASRRRAPCAAVPGGVQAAAGARRAPHEAGAYPSSISLGRVNGT
jgi:hypothetical protein